MVPAPVILDNLIAKKKIPPLVAVFVKHDPMTSKQGSELFGTFRRLPGQRTCPVGAGQYRVTAEPARTIVGGLSLGGLMASYCGLRHSDVFGNVLSQSGSYQWYPGGLEQDERTCRLRNRVGLRASSCRLRGVPCAFISKWVASRTADSTSGVEENRRFRDVLKAKGYSGSLLRIQRWARLRQLARLLCRRADGTHESQRRKVGNACSAHASR